MNDKVRITLQHVALLRRAGLATRPRKRIPRQRWPRLIEVEYAKAMTRLLDSASLALTELFAKLADLVTRARAARKVDRRDSTDVVVWVHQLLPRKYLVIDGVDTATRSYVRYDAGESDELAEIMRRVRDRLAQAVDPVSVKELAQKFAERTQTSQRIALGAQVKAALGADVFSADKRIPAIRDQFVGENVALITSIPSTVLNEVEGIVSRAFTNATPHDELLRQINERFNVGENRARLIARDQIGKLYGQTNAYRQQDLGIKSFIWRTSGDERVRDEHAALEGQEFNYPEGAPEEGLPGEPIQCRCSAEPVFGDLLSSEPEEATTSEPTKEPDIQRSETPATSTSETTNPAQRRIQQLQQAQQRAERLRMEQEQARVATQTAQAEHDRVVAESKEADLVVNQLVAEHHQEMLQAHEGFRIGVSSEITGNELPGITVPEVKFAPVTSFNPLPPPVTVPAHEATLPTPQSANVQLHIPAPPGFTGISHEGEIYYRHNISGRSYTPEQLAEKQAGKGVVLTGPNGAPDGFELIETAKAGDKYRSHSTGNTYTLDEIKSGYAAETEQLLLKHEEQQTKKPGLLRRLATRLLGK